MQQQWGCLLQSLRDIKYVLRSVCTGSETGSGSGTLLEASGSFLVVYAVLDMKLGKGRE